MTNNQLNEEQQARVTEFHAKLVALLKEYSVSLVPVMEKYGMKIEAVIDPTTQPVAPETIKKVE